MPKYQYSIIRFVPSPTRGEFVNLGVIVGNDATDEWTMEVVGKKSRAAKLDDAGILPLVSTELERLHYVFQGMMKRSRMAMVRKSTKPGLQISHRNLETSCNTHRHTRSSQRMLRQR